MQNHGKDPAFASFAADVRTAAPTAQLLVTAETFVPLNNAGFRRDQTRPVISDLGIHAFDQVRALIPAPPSEMLCSERAMRSLGDHCSICNLTVTFVDGSIFNWRGGFVASRQHRTAATGRWRAEWPGGSATWSAQAGSSIAIGDSKPQTPIELASGAASYQVCIAEMINLLHSRTTNPSPAAANLGSISLLEAALASAKHQRPVQVDVGPWTGTTQVALPDLQRGAPDAR
jgi:predicted dehydrogenase